ncbi:MAG: sensor histidine kinase [Candidatus Velamenicoccus archaeovorus]
MFRSLRLRIAASHATVLAVILLALGGTGLLLLSRDLDRAVTAQLLSTARQQVQRIEELGRAVPAPDSDVPSAASTQVAVFAPDGTAIREPTEVPPWLSPGPRTRDRTFEDERVRVVTLEAGPPGSPLAIVVAGRSLQPEAQLLHRVRLLLLSGGLVAVGLSMLAGWWLAGRAVRPVQAAYEAQAGFAADASHELRTPLTFIRSGVEVLAEHDPQLGGHVLAEVDYLTGLTRRLLDLARAEAGTPALERTSLDVAEACRSAARRSRAASGTTLELEGEDALPALGDRVALEAALDAVLENVGVHGGGGATVRWERRDTSAVVSVRDHGPGLPPELAARAFERFARADPSRSRSTGGAGLGLAVARALIEAQGGRMWLEPTPGGGLTASIALPTEP